MSSVCMNGKDSDDMVYFTNSGGKQIACRSWKPSDAANIRYEKPKFNKLMGDKGGSYSGKRPFRPIAQVKVYCGSIE